MNNNYCSPSTYKKSVKNGGICYTKSSLILLIKSWNKINKNTDKIKYKSSDNLKTLFELLDNKLTPLCGKGKYWFWPDIIKNKTNDYNIKKNIENVENNDLKPVKPDEWVENPVEWLSNYDIDNIMKQYNKIKSYKYHFLGVFPIDFTEKYNGKCLYSEICTIDVEKFIKNKIKYIGFITNLDKHDEPGSHWTSTFINIDPSLKSYGAYYYDSTARSVPKYILNLLKELKTNIEKIYPKRIFKIYCNNIKHQHSNTECGVFSLIYQLMWFKKLKENKDTTINDIIGNQAITDNTMYKVRDIMFRPNIKSLKQI